MSVEFSGKSRGVDAEHLNLTTNIVEAEGNLNPYLPHLCLASQLFFSLGCMVLQLLGFGMGETTCCGVGSGCGSCVGGAVGCTFRWCWVQRFSWLFDIDSAFVGSGTGGSFAVGCSDDEASTAEAAAAGATRDSNSESPTCVG